VRGAHLPETSDEREKEFHAMAYMLLVLEPPGQRATRTPAEGRDAYQHMLDFSAQLRKRGVLIAADALQTEAVRFGPHNGRPQRLDGPFTESKELIGGFILIDCESVEEALGFARECPAAAWATIEVRAVGTCYE
jgi:hypothetical protein